VRQELERDVFAAVEQELEALGLRKRPRADSLQERIDALKRQCRTGYSCGNACISLPKECRAQRGIAPVRGKEAAGLAVGPRQRLGGSRRRDAAANILEVRIDALRMQCTTLAR
jgi:hypothetical protein